MLLLPPLVQDDVTGRTTTTVVTDNWAYDNNHAATMTATINAITAVAAAVSGDAAAVATGCRCPHEDRHGHRLRHWHGRRFHRCCCEDDRGYRCSRRRNAGDAIIADTTPAGVGDAVSAASVDDVGARIKTPSSAATDTAAPITEDHGGHRFCCCCQHRHWFFCLCHHHRKHHGHSQRYRGLR